MRYAISYVIYKKERSALLVVKRPSTDPDLPNVWGLPAGSVGEKETFEEAVLRSGREKLGVELKIRYFIGRGNIERDDYILHMEEYEAEIVHGRPRVPQPVEVVTQYTQLKWGTADNLKAAARKGSLCCRLYLESINEEW